MKYTYYFIIPASITKQNIIHEHSHNRKNYYDSIFKNRICKLYG